MSRVDELRSQLAAAEAEDAAVADLVAAKEAHRANPGDPDARARSKTAAQKVRDLRVTARAGRVTPDPVPADAVVAPDPVTGGLVGEVG